MTGLLGKNATQTCENRAGLPTGAHPFSFLTPTHAVQAPRYPVLRLPWLPQGSHVEVLLKNIPET